MAVDDSTLKYYEKYYYCNDAPIPFKVKDNNYTIFIRPVKVSMYAFYQDNIGILCIDKNRVNDVNIISMSYLQYLVDIVLQEAIYQQALITILNLSLGDEYTFTIGHNENNKAYLGIQKDGETLCKITPKEFDKISEIILYYNDKDYDGRYISEDMRKAMEDYYNIKYKDKYIPTLAEKKAFVSFKSGLTLQQINDMSYRYFEILYNQCIENDLFFSQKIIQASEKYKVNDNEIVYPLFKKKANKFDFLQNADKFEKKVSAAAQG
jgi:hypothetical protein